MMRAALAGTAFVAALLASVPATDQAAAAPVTAGQASPATFAEITAVIKQAYDAIYGLDQPEALALARRSVAIGPNEASAHRALAGIVWLDILFRRGAVVSDHYLSGSLKDQLSLPKPPPDQAVEFNRELGKAIELAGAQVRRNPADLQARYDLGTAYALQASYTASVDGSLMAAFRLAKRAYDTQELVLERDPSRVDAGLVVGTYRYLVSTMSLPTRMLAYVVGFGGGKERGISLIEAATRGVDTHIDARVALLLIYSRARARGVVSRQPAVHARGRIGGDARRSGGRGGRDAVARAGRVRERRAGQDSGRACAVAVQTGNRARVAEPTP